MAEHMLTTVDNPYNPFTDFDAWLAYDTAAGYHTLSFLGRLVVRADDLSEADQSLAIEDAMQEIVRENVSGLHRLVLKPVEIGT